MGLLYLIFNGCLRHQSLDVETNPGPQRPVPVIRRILDLDRNLSDLTVASYRYDILVCSDTFVLGKKSRVGVAGSLIWSPGLVVPDQVASGLTDGGIPI